MAAQMKAFVATILVSALVLSVTSALAGDAPANATLGLKNYAFTSCIAKGLGPGDAANKASAAAREFVEHGDLPLEAYTKATELSGGFLKRDYRNIYGDDLVFIKCLDFYNSDELDLLARKYARRR